ncbi:hypothetical protein ACPPVO_44185 [Dactylosporangium sp. McL0621]|uniref:hypothetical protein n=1 Tax=Dactylosporangium sp. McL0621 TaxID=3415678 RepID=UPI003CEFB865
MLDRTVAGGADRDNAAIEPADIATPGPRLAFHRVPEGKTVKNRVHWVTLADPGGNEFDLLEG